MRIAQRRWAGDRRLDLVRCAGEGVQALGDLAGNVIDAERDVAAALADLFHRGRWPPILVEAVGLGTDRILEAVQVQRLFLVRRQRAHFIEGLDVLLRRAGRGGRGVGLLGMRLCDRAKQRGGNDETRGIAHRDRSFSMHRHGRCRAYGRRLNVTTAAA